MSGKHFELGWIHSILDMLCSCYNVTSVGAALVTIVAMVFGYRWIVRQRHHGDVMNGRYSSMKCSGDAGKLQDPGENQIGDTNFVTPMMDAQELLKEALGTPRYDPLEFCNHIQAQAPKDPRIANIKKFIHASGAQVKRLMLKMAHRDIEREMTDEQRKRERTVQMSQLDAIVRLIALQQKQSNPEEVDEADGEKSKCTSNGSAHDVYVIREQMKMYME